MPDVRLIDANALQRAFDDAHKGEPDLFCCNFLNNAGNPSTEWDCVDEILENAPTIDAQPVKHGHWSECYRDCRCISVICSVCKNPTVIAHGCRDADEVTMDYVIERLPHCPKCCSEMGGDADADG